MREGKIFLEFFSTLIDASKFFSAFIFRNVVAARQILRCSSSKKISSALLRERKNYSMTHSHIYELEINERSTGPSTNLIY